MKNPFGPITVFKLKFSPLGLNRKIVGEQWNDPDDSRILELSTKCGPSEADLVAREVMAFWKVRGVKPGIGQQTKTRTALDYFSKLQE